MSTTFDGSKVNLTDEKQVKFLANWLALRIFTGTKALEGAAKSKNGPFTHREIHETISRELMTAGTTKADLL